MSCAPDLAHRICCLFEKRFPKTMLTVNSTNAVDVHSRGPRQGRPSRDYCRGVGRRARTG